MSRIVGFPSNYTTPSLVGTIYNLLNLDSSLVEPSTQPLGGSYYSISYVKVTNASGTKTYGIDDYGRIEGDSSFIIQPGANTIVYTTNIADVNMGSPPSYRGQIDYTFTIYGIENKFPLKPWTNEEVINRVLQLAEPLRKGETPRFSLSSIGQGVSKEDLEALAPEYTFTRMNLREVMQTIGGTMHAEPRLDIYINDRYTGAWRFDKYGGTKLAEYKNFRTNEIKPLNQYKYITYKRSHDIEQACTKLDSYMDNLVNRIDWQKSTIGKPSENIPFGVTLRSETSYVRLEENNETTFFVTEQPIDTIESFELVTRDKYFNVKTYDITPYVYEKQAYNNLSSYSNTNPAKAFALYYTQGEKGIKGFFYKVPNATGGIYNNYSIVNILVGVEAISQGTTPDYMTLEFRVRYVPIYSTRVQHGKQYLADYLPTSRTINYTQGDNSVETRFFGENIKGVAQRLGTVEKYVTFILRHVSNIPKAGDLWDDDYYIATIQVSVLRDNFQITCGLSKNFNRKSKYIGADSHKRIYEVSEKMVQQRHTSLSDYIVIETLDSLLYLDSQKYKNDVNNLGIRYLTTMAFDFWTAIFDHKIRRVPLSDGQILETVELYSKTKVQSVSFKTYTINDNPIMGVSRELDYVVLPVIASSFGNVIEFTFECKDNFSAGSNIVKQNGDISGYFNQEVEYGDYYGRAYYLSFVFSTDNSGLFNPSDENYTKMAQLYPKYSFDYGAPAGSPGGITLASTYSEALSEQQPLAYRKDGREALRMSYCLETVAGDSSLIIGSALQRNNPLITDSRTPEPHLYTLTRRIGKFEDYIDTTAEGVTDYGEVTVLRSTPKVSYESYMSTQHKVYNNDIPALSWCIAIPSYSGKTVPVCKEDGTTEEYTQKLGGEILVGQNKIIQKDNWIGNIYAYCVHDIQAYITAKKKAGKL